MKEDLTEKMTKRLDKLFDLYPIEDLRPSEVNEEMKSGLARFYADKGQRLYIENAVKIALKNMAVAPDQMTITYFKSRIDVLEQLLAKGKECFNNEVTKKGINNAPNS